MKNLLLQTIGIALVLMCVSACSVKDWWAFSLMFIIGAWMVHAGTADERGADHGKRN